MQAWEIVLILAAVCGLLIAAGGLALLWKGAITLESAPKKGNLTIDVANKVKVSASYPGIALFIVGLGFIALPLAFLYFFDPTRFLPAAHYYDVHSKLTVSGGDHVSTDAIRVRVGCGISDVSVAPDGTITGTFVLPKSLDKAIVWVVAPGYSKGNSTIHVVVQGDKIKFDAIDLGERLLDTPTVRVERPAPEDAVINDRSRLPQALF